MSAPSGFNPQQSLLPEGGGTITAMSGGGKQQQQSGGADVATDFWLLLLSSCEKTAKDFTLEGKVLKKTTETQLR
jgi:hypothetical protein